MNALNLLLVSTLGAAPSGAVPAPQVSLTVADVPFEGVLHDGVLVRSGARGTLVVEAGEDRLSLELSGRRRECGPVSGPELGRSDWSTVGDGATRSAYRVESCGSDAGVVAQPARAALEEWLQPYDDGVIAHGLLVHELPEGTGALRLSYSLESRGFARPVASDDMITFVGSGGMLGYGGLIVYDAEGARLGARFELTRAGFDIVVETSAEPRLPLCVDPLFWYQEAEIKAAGGSSGDAFGRSVALDGDTLAVGAPQRDEACPGNPMCDSGAVYVYTRSGSTWTLQTKLIDSSSGASADSFGHSVALDGDTLVVGCPGADFSGATNAGAFYVYKRTLGVWGLQATRVKPALATAEDQVGWSVDVDGDRLVVGGRNHELMGPFSGAAWAYERTGVVWTLAAGGFLTGSDSVLFDHFGSAVAISGTRLAVGAPDHDLPMNGAGAVYVFEFGASWAQVAKLSASDASGSDAFGGSLSMDGDRLASGARFGDRGTTDPGAVYVFLRSGGGVWGQEDKLLATDLMGGDRFGSSVSLEGDRLAIGAPYDSEYGLRSGSAYVFERTGSSWDQQAKLSALIPEVSDEYGIGVALSGDTVAVGNWLREGPSTIDQGSVQVVRLKVPTYTPLCYGDGGDQLGCTNCPCGNNATPGSFRGCINGEGRGAHLAAFGVANQFADSLRFEMSGGNASTFGVLVAGTAKLPVAGACPPGSGLAQPLLLNGLRCVGMGVLRLGSRATDANGDIGVTGPGWGPPNGPAGGLIMAGGFVNGSTRYFQVFYRELASVLCMTGQNTSNAVEVTFGP